MRSIMRNSPPERLREIDSLLEAALDRPAPDRETFLDEACGGDSSLRAAVQRLLDAHHASEDFLELPGLAFAEPLVHGSDPLQSSVLPERIGPFRVIREIGHGGMGTVFLAERDDGQFEQRVALKLIRQIGRGGAELVSRFMGERRILALLEHPHIARLVDGGITSDDVPWFAMEYVDGEPIDRYCDTRALSIDARLDLFAEVCDAVQYAHEHLVIHRDLKPSNILVAGDGQLKLLDFGVAKLIGAVPRPSESLPTQPTVQPMTPEYAAPEQVRGQHVSSATDVYALGVLLYLLLTGRRPYEVRDRSPAELERIICEFSPREPSAVLTDTRDAARRRLLKGDLDTIVLKALNKEPGERYRSPRELAQDVRRYLSGHPVLARPQTVRYRMRRFVRRHRIETVAALAIALSLVVSSVLAVAQARRARGERDRAESASRETEAINAFLLQLFEASDPSEAHGDTLTARELVQRATTRVDRLERHPVEQARLLGVVGRLYQNLGQYDLARDALERALAARRSANRSSDDLEVAAVLFQLSNAFVSLSGFAAADSAAHDALSIQQRSLGPDHPALAPTLHQLAVVATYRGNLNAAEEYNRRAVNVQLHALGPDDSLTAYSHYDLGGTLRREGKLVDAEREFREGIAASQRSLGGDHPKVASGMLVLADLLNEDEGRAAEAEPLYRRALEIRRRAYGDGSPMVAYAVGDLAGFLARQPDSSAAIPVARDCLARLQRSFGATHPVVVNAMGQMALVLARAGATSEAEGVLRRAIELNRRIRGPDHPTVAGNETDLARLLSARGEHGEARELLRDATRISEKSFGANHPLTARTRAVNGLVLMHERRFAAADTVLRRALQEVEQQLGRTSSMARELYGWLADLEDARHHRADAARYRAIATAR